MSFNGFMCTALAFLSLVIIKKLLNVNNKSFEKFDTLSDKLKF